MTPRSSIFAALAVLSAVLGTILIPGLVRGWVLDAPPDAIDLRAPGDPVAAPEVADPDGGAIPIGPLPSRVGSEEAPAPAAPPPAPAPPPPADDDDGDDGDDGDDDDGDDDDGEVDDD